MSELISPCITTSNGGDRRRAHPEYLRSFACGKRRQANRDDDLPVQLRGSGAAHVLGVRNRLKMSRIHAPWLMAQVVELKRVWDCSDVLLIDGSMGRNALAADPDVA